MNKYVPKMWLGGSLERQILFLYLYLISELTLLGFVFSLLPAVFSSCKYSQNRTRCRLSGLTGEENALSFVRFG